MIMSVGNLIVPARDKSSLGNSILMSVGQSGGGGRLHAYMHGNRPEIMEYLRSPFPLGTEPVAQYLIFARLSLRT